MWRLAIVAFLSRIGLKLWPNVAPFFRRNKRLGLALFLICLIGMIATFFVGCGTTQQLTTKAPLYQYKPDIAITVDNYTYDGMAVADIGPKTIGIVSKAKLDLLMISSCHRNFTIEKVDAGWFGGASKKYSYQYTPTQIETEGFCPLYIQAFDKTGVTAWGYVAFRTEERLPAKMDCNGYRWTFGGVSVCSSRAGFEQGINFDVPVKFAGSELCDITKKSEKEFRLRTKEGFCYATFSDGKNIHRVVLLGYNEALVRGE